MDIKEAINRILDIDGHREIMSVLEADKEKTCSYIEDLLKDVVNEVSKGKKYEREYWLGLLGLIQNFRVKCFNDLRTLIDGKSFLNEGGYSVSSFEYGSSLSLSISKEADVEVLERIFFSENFTYWGRQSAFFAIQFFYSAVFDGVGNVQNMIDTDRRYERLSDFYFKVLNRTSRICTEHPGLYKVDNTWQLYSLECEIVLNIVKDCIDHHYYDNYKLKDKILSVIVLIITTSGLDSNCGLNKRFYQVLQLISPQIYCKACEAAEYISNLRTELYKLDIFTVHSVEEVGRAIYNRTKEETQCDDNSVRIAVQMLHRYPYDQRKSPVCEDEYYREINAYLKINSLPLDIYIKAHEEYDKVRNGYEFLIDKINNLEVKCEELKTESDDKAQTVRDKKRKITEDDREDKSLLLTEMLKRKELEALYRVNRKDDSEDEYGADSYLEYCKSCLEDTFTFFIKEKTSEIEIEETLKKWVLQDVVCKNREDYTFDAYRIEERFEPYIEIIKRFDELLLEDPRDLLRLLKFRIKSIAFVNRISDRHRSMSGKKILYKDSEEYKQFNKELKEHPLCVESLMNLTRGVDYLDRLESIMPEVIDLIHKRIEDSLCLKGRAVVLSKIIKMFEEHDYDIVMNMIPVQIEGLLSDFLDNSMMFYSDSEKGGMKKYENIFCDVLVNKTNAVNNLNLNLGFDTIGYFKYYFNSIYRNTVAHGNYKLLFKIDTGFKDLDEKQMVEAVASEMMLDLNCFVDMVAKSNELDEANRYLKATLESLTHDEFKMKSGNGSNIDDTNNIFSDAETGDIETKALERDLRYERLLLDLIGESRFNLGKYLNGIFVSYNPVQILYWIFNPQFEDIIGTEVIKPIRKVLLSKDFWMYAAEKIENKLCYADNGEKICIVMKNLMPLLKENTEVFKFAKIVNEKVDNYVKENKRETYSKTE